MTAPTRYLLESCWTELLTPLGCSVEECRDVFAQIVERYSSPERYYHNLDHIAAVLETTAELCPPEANRTALLLAAWFHDFVYEPRSPRNETMSAVHACQVLKPLRVTQPLLAEMERLILLTQTHQTTPDDRVGQALIDADLAILGAPQPAYDRYADAIRREYAWVPDEPYRAGRRQVLESFLKRPRIYFTDEMFTRAETRARGNLRREIASLAEPGLSSG
jgi:predicted metal-dependent HD superfamily phosphohydrolase